MKIKSIFTLTILMFIVIISCNEPLVTKKKNDTKSTNKVLLKSDEKLVAINKFKGEYTSWKEQLEYLKKGGYEGLLTQNGLTLKSYTLLNVDDQQMENKRYGLVSKTINKYEIKLLSDTSKTIVMNEASKKKHLQFFNDTSIKTVELTWDYRGKNFKSKCLVSEKYNTVVYDDIISNVIYFSVSSKLPSTNPKEEDSLRSSSNSSNPLYNKAVSIRVSPSSSFSKPSDEGSDYYFYRCVSMKNIYGMEIVQASISAKVGRSGSGTSRRIDDYECDGTVIYTDLLTNCRASVEKVSFSTGTSGSFEFKYIIAAGSASNFSCTWNGINFELVNGVIGTEGSVSVGPNTPSSI